MAITGAIRGSPLLLPDSLSPPFPPPGEDEYQKACDFKKAGNLPQAFFSYQSAAEKGHAEAQFQLAKCYEKGEGSIKDEDKAFHWYEKAAEKGLVEAQYYLGYSFEKGTGAVIRNAEESKIWLRKAAEKGHVEAQYRLGKRAFILSYAALTEYPQWLLKAAEKGHAKAQNLVGVCYDKGAKELNNPSEATKWYQKAADQDYPEAQYNLGTCYEKGNGVAQNYNDF
jgi:TPR repeat protein